MPLLQTVLQFSLSKQDASVVLLALYLSAAILLLLGGAAGAGGRRVKTVRITLNHDGFQPRHITLRKGEPVVLVITIPVAPMLFSAPGLVAAVDWLSSKTMRARLTPEKTGRFDFWCYVFRGPGNPKVSGSIFVVD